MGLDWMPPLGLMTTSETDPSPCWTEASLGCDKLEKTRPGFSGAWAAPYHGFSTRSHKAESGGHGCPWVCWRDRREARLERAEGGMAAAEAEKANLESSS